MPRHLVIDDMQVRHDEFDRILVKNGGHEIDHAYTVSEGEAFLRQRMIPDEFKAHKLGVPAVADPYGVIFLDHDIDSGYDRRDVLHFVQWFVGHDFIREEVRKAGTKFFIHSWNDSGIENMAALLRQHGFAVHCRKFRAEAGPHGPYDPL